MMLGLKIFVTAVCVYASIRFSGIAIEWLKEICDGLSPRNRRKNDSWFD